jgi:hypothetical protein
VPIDVNASVKSVGSAMPLRTAQKSASD